MNLYTGEICTFSTSACPPSLLHLLNAPSGHPPAAVTNRRKHVRRRLRVERVQPGARRAVRQHRDGEAVQRGGSAEGGVQCGEHAAGPEVARAGPRPSGRAGAAGAEPSELPDTQRDADMPTVPPGIDRSQIKKALAVSPSPGFLGC